VATTKREPAKPSSPGRKAKRSAPKLSPAHANGLKSNTRAGREPVHPSPSRHTAK
jgi:hypothetical protein